MARLDTAGVQVMSDAVIRADRLGKRYGAADALRDLDLEVARGEVLGYLGPNGAGKTTTIRLFLGLIRPTSGRAELFGLDAQRDAVRIHLNLESLPAAASFVRRDDSALVPR
jgi:ABC-2 type transport system ATP-binding protein